MTIPKDLLRWLPSSDRGWFLLVVGVALFVRAIYFVEFSSNPYFNFVYPTHDSDVVHKGALEVCSGNLLINSKGIKFPFYSYFVGGIYALSSNAIWAVWIVQFLLGALTAGLVFSIGVSTFNRRIGVLAGLIYSVYPQAIFYEGVMLRASLTTFFAVLVCYMLTRLQSCRSVRNAVWTGVALSLLVQCRANMILIFPCVLVWLYFGPLRRSVLREKARVLTALILVFVITGLPLLIRGIYVEKRFVLYDPSGPMVLLMGNLPDYDGLGWHNGSPRFREIQKDHDELVNNDFGWVLRTLGTEFLHDPLSFAGLYLRKTRHYFSDFEVPSNNNFYLHREFSLFILKNPIGNFSLWAALAVVGLVASRKQMGRIAPVIVMLVGTAAATIVFYIVSRFRMPAVPFLILLGTCGGAKILGYVREKQFLPTSVSLAAVVGLVWMLHLPVVSYIRPNDYTMMADCATKQKQYCTALPLYRKLLSQFPNHARGRRRIAHVYYALGDYDSAISEYLYALRLDPDDAPAHYGLSLAYYFSEKYQRAIYHCDKAVALDTTVDSEFLAKLALHRDDDASDTGAPAL